MIRLRRQVPNDKREEYEFIYDNLNLIFTGMKI